MLEDKLTSILQKYLGEYFSGLSKEALKVSVWKGDIELKNISLRPEALRRLQLPVVIKSGIVKALRVQIPWKSLGRSSIVIHLNGLELLLGPNESVFLDPASALNAKRKRVQDAEELILSRRDASVGKDTGDTRTWLSTIVDGVIGNLKLSISNIHVRYEDSLSEIHGPAAVGIQLDRLAAFSADKDVKETYVSGGELDCTRKALELHGLSVYCQPSSNDMTTASSDRWQFSTSEYLVEPLNGSASYSRAGKNQTASSGSPQQDLAVTLDNVSFALSEDQYRLIMKLVDKFAAAQRRQELADIRPSCSIQECPSAWWSFAIKATMKKIKKGRSFTDWNELIRRTRIRNAYIPLYAKHLLQRAVQKPFERNQELLSLETDVEPEVLLQWRLVAHELVSQEMKKQKGKAPRNTALPTHLDAEDWTQLQALLPEATNSETTVSEIVHTRWSVHVKESRSVIKDPHGVSLLSLICKRIQVASSMHLETTDIHVQVGPYCVESPEGALFWSGQGPENTLDFLCVMHPKGQNLDWVLHGSVEQAHVLFIKSSLDRIIEFFQSSDALSPALALDTADAFEQTVEEIKRQAQAQLTNFMRSVSRFEVVLDVFAPEITVPPLSEGFQSTRLVLNLGHLFLNSRAQPNHASTSSTTSDLYMKFHAKLENVSACFQIVNTASLRHQPAARESQILKSIPVLEDCSFVSSIEKIWVPQPDFPTLRISARAPSLEVHFSPEILHCLLRSAEALRGCGSQTASVVPWESADYKGCIHILMRQGISSTEIAWQKRVGAVAGTFLYILPLENSPLTSLEVKDLVSCDAGPACRFLAQSSEMLRNPSMSKDWSLSKEETSEVFHDADESSFPTHPSQETSGHRSSFWSMSDYYDAVDFPVDGGDKPLTTDEVPSLESRPALLDRPWKRTTAFVQVQYIMRVPDSPEFSGVNAELILDLSGLSFYCNRPTILALIGVSLDMAAVPTFVPEPAKSQPGSAADPSSLPVKAEVAEDNESTLFGLTLCVGDLRVTLNGDDGLPLAVLTKQKLVFQLQVCASSFLLDAELGQLRICDLSLGEGHQYGLMFSPRSSEGQSFAKITLTSSSISSNGGGSEYSLSVQTSEIRMVYLNRFIQEVTSYLSGLSPPPEEDTEQVLHSPESVEDPSARAVDATAVTPIKLAILFGELLLLLPKSSSSEEYLEFDVGRLEISNSIEVLKLLGDGNSIHDISLDVMKVEIDGIRLHTMAKGHVTDNMIARLVGLQVFIERPLGDPTGLMPGCHISVKVGHLQGGMCSAEYATVLDCVSGNFSEMPRSTLVSTAARDSTPVASVTPLKHVDMKLSVHIQSLALLLYEGSSREATFSKLQVSNLSLRHFLHSGGISQLFLSIFQVFIKDLTPGVATEERWVLGTVDDMEGVITTVGSESASSADWPTHLSLLPREQSGAEHIHPSLPMLILESQFTGDVQSLSLRIQRPRLLLAPPFISHLVSFFTRSEDVEAVSASVPQWRDAFHLHTPYTLQQAPGVLEISSQRPLVADVPEVSAFTFDGNEGSIELVCAERTEATAAEAPLIIVGPGKHLRFKNVHIYGAEWLASVIKLGAGSSYSVDEVDGVRLLPMRPKDRPSQQIDKPRTPQPVPEQSSGHWKFNLQVIGMELIAIDQARWAAIKLSSPENLLRLKASLYVSIQTVRGMSEVNVAVRSSGISTGSGLCVIEPVDSRMRFTSSTGYTDIQFSVSNLRTHITLNTLEIILRMQEKYMSSVYSVAEKPQHLCLQFKKVWAYAGRSDMQRISFWRPIAPPGFVVLGDCLTTDDAPPTRGVLASRVLCVGANSSPGFVAVGCVAHPGAQPPSASAVYCIEASHVCPAALRGCITVQMNDGLQSFKLWRIENALNTFSARQEQEAACQQVEASMSLEVPSVAISSRQQEGFQQAHFFKLAWESRRETSSTAISVWRPLCPEGFAFLGDVIHSGCSPPDSSVIIEEVDDSLLVKPSRWKLLKYIPAQGTQDSVAFWSAIPPPGYSSLGVVVTTGKTAPSEDSFRCVRNDACVPVKIASAPVFELVSRKGKPLCKLWPVENQIGSFLVTTKGRKGPPRRLGLGIFVLDEQQPVSRVYVDVSLPVFSVTLFDDFGSLMSPLVKISLDNLVVKSLYYGTSDVHQVSSGCSVDAFNNQQDAWEPFLEPWHGMVRAELAGKDGLEPPLSTCRVVSNSKVNINLSSMNVNHFGEAYADWLKLLEAKEDAERVIHMIEHDKDEEGDTEEYTHATERRAYIVQHNSSGIDLFFRVVDKKLEARVFCLPSGSQACIVVPPETSSLHPSPEHHSGVQSGSILAFGVGDLQIPKELASNPEELVCSVSLTSAINVNGFQCAQHARTSMKVPASAGNSWLVSWNEVFLFESTLEEGEAVCVVVERSTVRGLVLFSFTWAVKPDVNMTEHKNCTTGHSWLSSNLEPVSSDHGTAQLSVFHHFGKIGADGRLEPLDEVSDLPIREQWQPFQMSLTKDGPWSPINSVYGGGVVPKQLGGTMLAVQVSMVEGEKHLNVRSLVALVNKTEATLEVCLCPRSLLSQFSSDEHDRATVHAAVSERVRQGASQDEGGGVEVEVVEIFENERHLPFLGWSSSNLLPIDPKGWSDLKSKSSSKCFKEPELPAGWIWSSDWHIEVSEHVDKDGWAYFPSFLEASWPPRGTARRVKGFPDAVRRRRWVRFRQQSPLAKAPGRVICGLVEPGSALPLPVLPSSTEQTDPCIQIRPYVAPSDESATTAVPFSWGSVDKHASKVIKDTSTSRQALPPFSDFPLLTLGKTQELLSCQRSSTDSEHPETRWMLVESIGTPLSKRSNFTPTMDWEIVAEAPMTFCNLLPEPITLSIWSSDPLSTDVLLKEDGLVLEPGAKKGILSVHPKGRLLVCLKICDVWVPRDESEERLTIFHPQKPLPSDVTLMHKDTHRQLQVSIDRTWSATFGTLKEVIFSVPCWVDTAGCPPLVLSLSHGSSVAAIASGSFHSLKRAWTDRKWDGKTSRNLLQSQLHKDEVVHVGPEGRSTVMLSKCDDTSVIRFALDRAGGVEEYGPDLSIATVQSQSTMCDSQATAADGSYLPLVAFMDVSPFGSQATKVLKVRPLLTLTNRLGEPVFVRPPGSEEHITELAPSDWHRPLVYPRGFGADTFQVRTSLSEWSYPLKLSVDAEVIAVVRLLRDNSRHFIRIDARSGGATSKHIISFRFGGLHLPFKLENHSSHSVYFRQSGLPMTAWEVLLPKSASAFAWEVPDEDHFLEVYAWPCNEASGDFSGSRVNLPDTLLYDLSEPGDLASLPLPAAGHLRVQSFDCDSVRIVRFTNGGGMTGEEEGEQQQQQPQQRDGEVAAPAGSTLEQQQSANVVNKGSRMEISLDLMSVGLSIIDQRPQELLYAFSEGFLLEYHYDGRDDSSRVKLILKSLRIDNQLPLSPLPVLLFLEQKGMPEKDYVFKFLVLSRGSMKQDEVCYPKLTLWLAQEPWQVNVHEAIVWRLWELLESICWEHFSPAESGGVDGGAVAAVQVDPMIRIDRLVVSDAHLKLTLEAAPTSRPAQLLGAWNSLVTAAGNTKRMPVRLSGATAESRRLRRSIFMEAVVRHVLRDILHQSLRLLSGVDVLGVISSTLTALGHGASRLVHKEDMVNRHFQQALGNQLDNVGEGLLYGAEAMAKGVALGVTDVLVRSRSGYETHGPPGLLLGLSKGLAGLVVHPVTGCLHSLAFLVAGVDASTASCARMVQRKPQLQRLRLPRAISADGVVHEYSKDDAVGQMVLFMAEAGSYFGRHDIFRDHSKFALSDAYVNHILLPNCRILLITSRRVMMLECPVDPAGQPDSLALVQGPSLVRWDVSWDNLLALETKPIPSFPRPVVCVHMREPTPQRLYAIIRCRESHPAEHVLADIASAFETYGPKPVNIQAAQVPNETPHHSFLSAASSQSSLSLTSSSARPIQPTQSRRFGRQHSVRTSEAALAIGRSALTNIGWVYLSIPFQDAAEAGHFAIWKPVPPEGYVSLGDVAWRGLTPPPAVRVHSITPTSLAAGSAKAFATPKDYFLVWRNRVTKTQDPVSIWRPIPPEGYVDMGCVAVGGYDKPTKGDSRLTVHCVRQDLVRPAEVEEVELWHTASRWEHSWGCHVHQVNNAARTFIAVRSREEREGIENGWDV
ncbi:unnamed protein product [Closterium sp. Yama58-4]|nr:unnamed protein product [Closterium sp. Yama58-4]